MPVRKQEAHRALELLEEYHCKLNKPQDKQLRNAIERVIRIFKSRLFQALLGLRNWFYRQQGTSCQGIETSYGYQKESKDHFGS
ncbi:disks large 1 tumor suppressor protein [Trichonephila clavipes]|nr:disks large 1 tumor suppressor protein [Trichonephila clavipes]